METIISAIIGIFVAVFVTSRVSQNNALHSESIWRQDLYGLTKHNFIYKDDVIYMRTFLSALRGTKEEEKNDKNYKKNTTDIDNLIIDFCNTLTKDDFGFEYEKETIETSKNSVVSIFEVNIGNFKGSKVLKDKEAIIFRQLCRLLLKQDWNFRNRSLLFLNPEASFPSLKAYDLLKNYSNSFSDDENWNHLKDKLRWDWNINLVLAVIYIITLSLSTILINLYIWNTTSSFSDTNTLTFEKPFAAYILILINMYIFTYTIRIILKRFKFSTNEFLFFKKKRWGLFKWEEFKKKFDKGKIPRIISILIILSLVLGLTIICILNSK